MKKMMIVAAMMVIGVTSTAQAIDLRNEDQVTRTVTVKSSAMTRDVELRGLTMSFVVCVGVCQFEVDGVVVQASKNDIVTIKDGKVTTERR